MDPCMKKLVAPGGGRDQLVNRIRAESWVSGVSARTIIPRGHRLGSLIHDGGDGQCRRGSPTPAALYSVVGAVA